MNSRSRILDAINHKQPDKIPIDLGSSTATSISAIAYHNLLKYLKVQKNTRVFDVIQQLACVDKDIIDKFGVDALDIGRLFCENKDDFYKINLPTGEQVEFPNWFKPLTTIDGYWVTKDKTGSIVSRMAPGATFFDQVCFPYEEGFPENFDNLQDDLQKIHWISQSHSNYVNIPKDELRNKVSELRKNSDKALVLSGGGKFFEISSFLRRLDNILVDLLMEPAKLELLLDKLLEMQLPALEKKCKALNGLVDVIRLGDDLGMISGPFMDLDTFRKFFKSRHKILCDCIKKFSDMKIFLHSCGAIKQYIPDLIEIGYDIINPVQTNCTDMDPVKLKEEFGKDICFWGGGVDTASVLNRANPKEIRQHVLERCEIFSKDGGFVFATIHNILPDVPPENILATFNAVREFNGDNAID